MAAPPRRGRAMSRLWANDAELAKKDDDHLAKNGRQSSQWQASTRLPRRRIIMRLAAYAFVLFIAVFILLRLFRPSDTGAGRYTGSDRSMYNSLSQQRSNQAGGSGKGSATKETARTYTGPVKFPALGQSLQAISATGGKQPRNRNVLFATASLKSANSLIPLACKMSRERQNYVHFAFIGRSEISLPDLLKINGEDETCQMIMHDARPDFPGTSTEARMMVSTIRALHHIHAFMHPQAVLIDSTDAEEEYFVLGTRDQIQAMDRAALIELPDPSNTQFSWITKLDSSSLAAWDKIEIDILIQAPARGAANLGRLLRSLSKADLSAMAIPHITIELPHAVDAQIDKTIADFEWPTAYLASGSPARMVSLRRRIPRQKLTEEESSLRFMESYWPRSPSMSHILVLSPHTELHPQFFHYLKYTLLHHRFSNAAMLQDWNSHVMSYGFSSPKTLLDMSEPLEVPGREASEKEGGAFVWQGPNSDATVFAGNKWIELHSFISRGMEIQDSDSSVTWPRKETSKKHPAWLEYALQLSRLRGYYTIYPGSDTAEVILGIHDDIPDVPEEYSEDSEAQKDAKGDSAKDQATSLFDADSKVSVLSTLSGEGGLPSLLNLPILSWDGREISPEILERDAREYAAKFRREVGQCGDTTIPKGPDKYARDLFCTPKEEDV
ncbi:hypothetical protein V2G26_006600 [Clonostachys chloroleuca]